MCIFPHISSQRSCRHGKLNLKQDSPPMWRQEVYRPRHILSMACQVTGGNGGGEYPILSGEGVSLSCQGKGDNPVIEADWDTLISSLPTTGLTGVPLPLATGAWLGYPPPRKDIHQTWDQRLGYPFPPVDRQTDACQIITFPAYYVRGR